MKGLDGLSKTNCCPHIQGGFAIAGLRGLLGLAYQSAVTIEPLDEKTESQMTESTLFHWDIACDTSM